MNKKKLVVFDLDGTLLNTIDDLASSVNYALKCYGYPEHDLSEYPYFVGNGIDKLIERALPESDRNVDRVRQLRCDFQEYYDRNKAVNTRPYAGIEELLGALDDKGVRMAVASNKYQQATRELIAHYFPQIPFTVVFGQREGVNTKPDPTVVFDILKLTGIDRADALYVGDSGVDMRTALNSGVDSVGVTWGFRPRQELIENGAKYVVDTPAAILEYC